MRVKLKHRDYVGPQVAYDLIAAMTFNLLTKHGLREDHRVLDIGCGSLRNGRLLIVYLNPENYVGVEPHKWLIRDGIKYELGKSIVRIKKPKFIIGTELNGHQIKKFDYIFAQSIFSHGNLDLIDKWFEQIQNHLNPVGICLFTYFKTNKADKKPYKKGWHYPSCVKHTFDDLMRIADSHLLDIKEIDCKHPYKQQWVLMEHQQC